MMEGLSEVSIDRESLIQVVGAVIINKNTDHVLVARRSLISSHPSKWEFVGGKVEESESVKEALERETLEEIGVEIEVGDFLGESLVDLRNKGAFTHKIIFHECFLKNGVPGVKKDIHQDLRWVSIADLSNFDWIESDKEFVARFIDSYKRG